MLLLRDRDAPITEEGIVFRTYGYTHPPNAAFCDVEYAPASIYQSSDPRAVRYLYRGPSDGVGIGPKYFKFYFDGGLRYVQEKFPQYQLTHKALKTKLVGITEPVIIRRPDEKLEDIMRKSPEDGLINTLMEVIDLIIDQSQLKVHDFGIFGSILHNFYHVDYSDLDFIIYGRRELRELQETLADFYQQSSFPIQNEFAGWDYRTSKKHWYFKNYSIQEYPFYDSRKLIYAIIQSKRLPRRVKIEFEPVKKWSEIKNEYSNQIQIEKIGWIEVIAEVVDDRDAFFMESIYGIEVLDVLEGPKNYDIRRILSFVEEFRGQVKRDETILVAGNLEKVTLLGGDFYQITLSYGPHYYDQTLKIYKK
ncbi:MAG: hypothetical protein ACTSQI_06465 [Candidatus Helarchaeota archaeon]